MALPGTQHGLFQRFLHGGRLAASSGASVGYVPQALQGIHNMDTHLFTHLEVADVDVERGDDGSLTEVLRDNAVDDAPEPPDVVSQYFLSFLLQVIEVGDGCRVRRAAGLEVLAGLAFHVLPRTTPGVGALASTFWRRQVEARLRERSSPWRIG